MPPHKQPSGQDDKERYNPGEPGHTDTHATEALATQPPDGDGTCNQGQNGSNVYAHECLYHLRSQPVVMDCDSLPK